MEVLQIDHTLVDVIVVDQEQRLPTGRPWLTLAIDVTTRMVAGFHISLWGPSTVFLCLTLSHAVLPKNSWLADRELQNRAEQRRRPLDDADLTGAFPCTSQAEMVTWVAVRVDQQQDARLGAN